ncbi:MAG: divergent PAP2 family protein [Spirochaetaceae bacterium]|jgi:acid phosphatase family membrane protein YuiD|nr:divergent PAP2 family protein [Spirochaetaceae bacterium]
MSLATSVRGVALKSFFENPIFLSTVSSWFFAQVIKAMILLLSGRKRSIRSLLETLFWRTGGMPSSHAAMVTAMTTSVAFKEGIGSNLFIVSFWVALIVMRDAMGVRRSSGIQAKVLNLLGRNIADRLGVEYHPVKEVNGHTPLEVVVGGLLGIFIAAAYTNL